MISYRAKREARLPLFWISAWARIACLLAAGASLAGSAQIQTTNPAPPFPVRSLGASQTNSQFGAAGAAAGDVNGDGFADFIVGAPKFSQTLPEEGAAFVYYGSTSGVPPQADWTVYGEQSYADFGISVAAAGDVNRDGFDDVIVGAPGYTFRSGEYNVGAALVYLGSTAGLTAAPTWVLEGPQTNSHFGYSAAGAGDVNGDGFADLIVGARFFPDRGERIGKVFVYHGSARGFRAVADWTFAGDQPGAQFGYRVASAGDVNRDGFADVIVSARDYDTPKQDAGRVFVFYGSRQGLGATPSWTFEGLQPAGRLGSSCGASGDVNGDGFSDVIVGAFGESHGEQREGAAYVFYGSPKGLGGLNWFVECNQQGSALGQGVSAAGDVNGDGFADVIIGAPSHRGKTGGGEGRAFVFHGSRDGLQTEPAWVGWVESSRLYFGRQVCGAGDINRDGFADVMVGTISDSNVSAGGMVMIYPGSSNGILPNLINQMPHRSGARRFVPPVPPLWSHGWFWGVVALILAGGAATGWHVVTTTRLKRLLREAEQVRMLQQERLRIAQDLHDHLGSDLTTITLLSEVARRDVTHPGKLEDYLSHITGTARALTRALEEIVWSVNPRKDKLDQMAAYFSAYAEEFLKPTELRCRLDFPDEMPDRVVPPELRHPLLLVFKEALTNVVKHAAATEVRIGLDLAESRLRLSIEDNGRGFDPSAIRADANGLANMRSRIVDRAGDFRITSQAGRGTRIYVEVALAGTEAAR